MARTKKTENAVDKNVPVEAPVEPSAKEGNSVNLNALSIPLIAKLLFTIIENGKGKDAFTSTIDTRDTEPLLNAIYNKGMKNPCSYKDCPLWRDADRKNTVNNVLKRLIDLSNTPYALIDETEARMLWWEMNGNDYTKESKEDGNV